MEIVDEGPLTMRAEPGVFNGFVTNYSYILIWLLAGSYSGRREARAG